MDLNVCSLIHFSLLLALYMFQRRGCLSDLLCKNELVWSFFEVQNRWSILLLSAAAAAIADTVRGDVSDEGKNEWDNEEDTNTGWLASEDSSKTVEAVLSWGTIVDFLEVEEETGLANTIAFQVILDCCSEALNVLSNLFEISGCTRLRFNVLVAVPEVIENLATTSKN
jgi:hypothetical protein